MKLKALYLFILLTLVSGISIGQTPGAFKYQAIVRDATGMPIVDTEVNIQIGIYSLDSFGPIGQAYVETHLVNTNGFGLINLEVGNGMVEQGDFSSIPWGLGEQYIEIGMDILGGYDFTSLGSSQILAVPMAGYAAVAGNVVDTSIYNEIQHIDLEHTGILTLSREGGEVDLSIFNDSALVQQLREKVKSDSLYFEGELDDLLILINEEVIRATDAESDLGGLITQNAVQILSDSLHFQYLIDNLSSGSNTDSLYFKNLIDANTQKIISDSAFLKMLIDQNTFEIQQEITRAILSEAINATNIANNNQSLLYLQASRISDSSYFQSLVDQNANTIAAEITRAILAEITNSNNIALNSLAIAQNSQDIYDDSTYFQNQITQIDFDLQQEITRAVYKDQVNSDSIQLIYTKVLADSIHFQTQIDGLSGGGLDPSLENGKIFIGNAADVATGVHLSGDAQLTNTGVMLISPSAITTSKVANGNITNAKLDNSSFTISDDQGNSGQIELGNSIQFQSNGATNLNYHAASHTMEITSTDNQLLNVVGNNLSISSGNAVDLSAIIGQVGPQGPTGPQGSAGINGVDGANGTNGTNGVGIQSSVNNGDGTFTITYSDGSTFTSVDLTGPQGNQGIQGVQGIQGPTGATGTNGVGVQSTVNNGNGTFTIHYTDGSSFTTVDFTGPQGVQGPIGPQGAMGPNGNNGVGILSTVDNSNGTFTLNYTDGSSFTTANFTGPQGTQGVQGLQGVQGPIGPQGPQGIQGVAGNDGISINWLGTIWPTPSSPNLNDAYRNPVDRKSYIWNGSVWYTITEDGAIGPQGPTGPQGPAGTSLKDCPAGAWSAINEDFCIEVNENGADTWWNAAKFCGDQNAHLCSWNEWFYVCQKTGSGTINMTNDWEWTNDGQAGASPTATIVGDGSCTSSDTDNMSNSKSFRCCFSR